MKTERYYPSDDHEVKKPTSKSTILVRVVGGGAIGLAIGGGFYGLSSIERATSNTVRDYGDPNTKVNSVTIDDEARLRSEPATDLSDTNSNILEEIHLKNATDTISIPTPNGVHETVDENGRWFGIDAADLPDSLKSEVKNDSDGIVWVNEQKASETLKQ